MTADPDIAAGQPGAATDPGGRAQLDSAAGRHQVITDLAEHANITTGEAGIIGYYAADRNRATRGHEIGIDVAFQIQLAAGDHRITVDGGIEIDLRTGEVTHWSVIRLSSTHSRTPLSKVPVKR